MRKNRLWLFFLMFAVVFAIPSVALGFVVADDVNNRFLAKNGVVTEATVIKGSYKSNTTINGVPYYTIKYSFYDEEWKLHYGTTSQSFTIGKIYLLEEDGTIEIRYDEKTFESIEAGYRFGTIEISMIGMMIAFACVDLVMWSVMTGLLVKEIKQHKAYKLGVDYKATFVGYSSGMRVNKIPVYCIVYSWVDDNGETKEGKTGNVYSYEEAEIFRKAKTFYIKAKGNLSIITSKPEELKNFANQISQLEE